MKLTKSQLKQIIKEELTEARYPRITQLPLDADTPRSPEEDRMNALSERWEKEMLESLLVGLQVPDFDGQYLDFDEFSAKMGNYVVTGDGTEEEADKIFRLIGNNLRVDKEALQHWNEPDPYAGEGEDY